MIIIFANSLDLDQDRQNVGPDLDPNCLTLRLMVFMKKFSHAKVDFEEKSINDNKIMKNYPACKKTSYSVAMINPFTPSMTRKLPGHNDQGLSVWR